MAFVDEVKDAFGIEPICRVLSEHGVKIAPSTYYAHKRRPVSARAVRDEQLKTTIAWVHGHRRKGRGIAGRRKMWHLMTREGHPIAKCTLDRLMRDLGLKGVVRGKGVWTTRPDPAADRPADLVQRRFTATRPRLWVVDFKCRRRHWMSPTHLAFGRSAVNFRLIRSGNGALVLSCLVRPLRRRILRATRP